MVAVTIKNSSGVKFTFSDGEVSNVDATIEGEIDQTKLPGSGPSATLVFDFAGAAKKIQLRGRLIDDGTNHLDSGSAITILEQKQFLEKIIDGIQTPQEFTSDFESKSFNGATGINTKVSINSMSFRQEEANPDALPFDITLLVGT